MSQVTKRALVASLKNQLLKKPLDKVTISDITYDCGISRMTLLRISMLVSVKLQPAGMWACTPLSRWKSLWAALPFSC